MQSIIRRTVRPVAGTLVAVVALLFPLTCATGQAMTQEHQACCAAMGHECGGPLAEQDCCSVEAAHVDQFVPATKVAQSAPATLATLDGMAPQVVEISACVRFPAHVNCVHPPGSTRTYLLVSALLI